VGLALCTPTPAPTPPPGASPTPAPSGSPGSGTLAINDLGSVNISGRGWCHHFTVTISPSNVPAAVQFSTTLSGASQPCQVFSDAGCSAGIGSCGTTFNMSSSNFYTLDYYFAFPTITSSAAKDAAIFNAVSQTSGVTSASMTGL